VRIEEEEQQIQSGRDLEECKPKYFQKLRQLNIGSEITKDLYVIGTGDRLYRR
jgi:hypothetical protein